LQFYPDSHFSTVRLCDTLSPDGPSPEFTSLIESGVKRFPREPRFWSEHAHLLEASGDKLGAMAAFRRAIALGMKQPWIMSHLAYLMMDQPDRSTEILAEAKELLQASLALDETSSLTNYRLGEVLWAEGKKTQALRNLRRAAELAPDTGWIWSHLGGRLVEAGKLAEAQPALKRADQLQPDDMLTQFRLGRFEEESGNIEEALKRIARALALNPGQPWVWRHYANLLARLGRTDEAEKALDKAGDRR
jgi:tetratricopeptide (TPR) repeat protein